jgi:hypothetical protein
VKKLFIVFCGVFAAILAFATIVVFVFSRDILPPDDKDLALKTIVIPKEENAFYDLERLGNSLEKTLVVREPPDIFDYLAGKKWDEAAIAKALEENKYALSLFDAAVQKPKFQDPAFADPTKISLGARITTVSATNSIVRISALMALHLMKQGREKEALDEAMKIVELGGKMQKSQGTFIHYLAAAGIKRVGLETIQRIARESKMLSPEIVRPYITRLETFTQNEEELRQAFKMEYHMNALSTDMVASGKLWFGAEEGVPPAPGADHPFHFKPNKTKLLFAQLSRDYIADVGKPCAQIETKEVERKIPKPSAVKLLFTENGIGQLMYDAAAVGLKELIISKCGEDFHVAATQAMLALRAYRVAQGVYPASLQELVPNYIPQIPLDPFDGQPIRYSATKKILYSVGKDGVDSGGSEGDNWQDMPDPTFKIE